jgi:ribokinase
MKTVGRIVVVGSSNTDLTIKTDKLPKPGETVLGGTFMMAPGGKGANQAVAVRRLGGDVRFVAKTGDDIFGNRVIEQYRRDNLDTSLIVRDPAAASGVALITVDHRGENCIVVAPGANNTLTRADIDAARHEILSADYLLMQLEIPMEIVEYCAAIASEAGVRVVLDPAPAAPLSDDLLRRLHMVTPNREESFALTGIMPDTADQADRAADSLLARGVDTVVVTMGADGAFVKNHTVREYLPPERVEAVDTTAAGDVFNGGLLVALAEGMTLVEAVRFAGRAAAISVTRRGAQPSIPFRGEVD